MAKVSLTKKIDFADGMMHIYQQLGFRKLRMPEGSWKRKDLNSIKHTHPYLPVPF